MIQPFHLAIPVQNLEKCRTFYRDVLGCEEGRSDTHWVDFNFFGHQLVIHQKEDFKADRISNPVDGHDVPVPHFGVVLTWEDWHTLALQKLDVTLFNDMSNLGYIYIVKNFNKIEIKNLENNE